MSDSRLEQLKQWLLSATDQSYSNLHPASEDASFRRYFRVTGDSDQLTYIVMDAPPDKEDCRAFTHITAFIRQVDVNSPEVIAQDLHLGFLLLSDLGTRAYLDHLSDSNVDAMYDDAIDALIKMQSIKSDLPSYDAKHLLDEMMLFETWYLNKHLGVTLDDEEQTKLDSVFLSLIHNTHKQPHVFVHRDYHSRNLMLLDNNNPGVIDFQDAVIGPVTYDLVSLFKDCYIEWPREKVEFWLDSYLSKTGLDVERAEFIKWFDLMGVQRHLKVLGIFSRLNYRDNKHQFLDDLPLTLKYVVDTCNVYPELKYLKVLLEQFVLNHPEVDNDSKNHS